MSDEIAGTPVEGAGTPEPAATPDPWAAVNDRVGELASNMSELQQGFQTFIQANQPEPEPEPDPWAALFQQDEEPEPEPQTLDVNTLQSVFDQALQRAQQPLQNELHELRQDRAREQLLNQIPQLKDPEVAQAVATGMQTYFQANRVPQHVQEWMVNDPATIGTFFQAAEAQKLAQGQEPAGDGVPVVEAAGGAVPGGNGQQPSYVQAAHENAWTGLPKGLR